VGTDLVNHVTRLEDELRHAAALDTFLQQVAGPFHIERVKGLLFLRGGYDPVQEGEMDHGVDLRLLEIACQEKIR